MADESDYSVTGFDSIDESDVSLEGFDVLDHQDVAEFNTANILPQEEATVKKIRIWLNATQYAGDGSEYQRHCSSHLKGTSQWALTSPEFKQWHESHVHGILWVRGIPGSGKSVLASAFITHLLNEGPVMYFFFRHSIESNRRPEAAIRDWLSQILTSSPPLQLALTKEISKPVESLTAERLYELLQLALENLPRAFCVVDALDEMDHVALQSFLKILDQLGNVRPKELKVIMTSRPIVNIQQSMRGIKLLDIRLEKSLIEPDILAYIQHKLAESHLSPESHPRVVESILHKSGGLFLYAKLAIEAIAEVKSEPDALETLERLPADLSAVYKELLKENLERTDHSAELQMLVLQLVTHATRPLRLLEISDCIKVTQPHYGDDSGKIKDAVRSVCGSLLEILPDETVCIIHHSLVEYLLAIDAGEERESPVIDSGPTHELLARLCILYLTSGCLELVKIIMGFLGEDMTLERGQIFAPLTRYAACNWFIHLKKAIAYGFNSHDTLEALYKLLVLSGEQNAAKLTVLAKLGTVGRQNNGEPLAPEVQALHLAVELELIDLATIILKHHGDKTLSYDGGRDNEPLLHHAVAKGSEDIVRLFITHGAQLNQHNSRGYTPLHITAGLGYGRQEMSTRSNAKVARVLLEAGANPWNSLGKDKHVDDMSFGRPQLPSIQFVFGRSDEAMAEAFSPFIRDTDGASQALGWAIHGGRNSKIIRMILGHPCTEINAKNQRDAGFFAMTPLYAACTLRDPKMISILLDAGADPNIPHREEFPAKSDPSLPGYNALHAIANPYSNTRLHGYKLDKIKNEATIECFKLIIAAGGNVNQVGQKAETPLHVSRDPVSVICLLDAGADLDAVDSNGYTLLQRTSNLKIIEALLPRIDVNAVVSPSGQRLLTRALVEKDVNFSIKLLDQGADATILDHKGNSVLHLAAKIPGIETMPNRKLLNKLIEGGADPNIRNSDGKTALQLVVNSFYFDETKFTAFLDAINPDLESRDEKGRTITFAFLDEWDSQRENYALSFLAIMLERGARFDVTDNKGRTLLHVAIRLCVTSGNLLKFLVEKGVDPQQPDLEGNTIWHEGARWFPGRAVRQQVFMDLQELGVSCNWGNSHGVLPFHVLCRFKKALPRSPSSQEWPCAFDILRETNPEVINSTDNDGVSPLHITSTCSTNLTRRLLELGADITQTTHEKLTVFHLAARSRQVDVIWLLIDWFRTNREDRNWNEFLNARDVMGRTASYYACASGSNEVVQVLLDEGAAANTETFIGSTWNGVADFEEEQKNWIRKSSGSSVHHDNPFYKQDAGGVLISDNLRPKPEGIESNHYPAKQIDKVVNILIAGGSRSDIALIDKAIVSASQKKNEHTVKCLEDARTSLIAGLETQDGIGSEDLDSFGLLQSIIPGLLEEMSLEERDANIHQKLLGVIDEGDVETLRRILSTGQVNANLRTLGKEVWSWSSADKRSVRPARPDPNTKSELYVLDYLVTCDSRKQNDYHVAIGKRMFSLLLEYGADLNSRYESKTLLHRILERRGIYGQVYSGENPYLDLMLKHPSLDIEATDGTGATLFLRACALVDVPVAEVLLERGASVTARDNQKKNALHHLCSHFCFMTDRVYGDIGTKDMAKQREFLTRLIQLAPDLLFQVDKHGRTPLLCALGQAGRGRDLGEGIDALLEHGADVTAPNTESGETPLHLLFGGRWQIDAKRGDDVAAVCGRRQELLHKFLARGADINAKDRAGETPAFRFMRKGIVKVKVPGSQVDRSLRGEAYFAAEDLIDKRKGEAAVRLQGLVLDLFSQVGVDWTHLSTRGQSLLHVAAGRGEDARYHEGGGLGRFRYLMGKGLDVLAEDDQHRSALDFAAASGAEDILEYVRREHGYGSEYS
ncbi:unnamed protein product [Clonostachys byssicola]|uniref:NACHT domain-containing protein n=1 Tax=Clonostachys byssicola TaxID=160290 RepID=A0A9N9UHC2_9HYPO|nr:unnamed protein product [Clonostachys byssicola]